MSVCQLVLVVLIVYVTISSASHLHQCTGNDDTGEVVFCEGKEYCCGKYSERECCSNDRTWTIIGVLFAGVFAFLIIGSCCVYCVKCESASCCPEPRRAINQRLINRSAANSYESLRNDYNEAIRRASN